MSDTKKRIGLMGGTFDPIHIGHLILGEKAYEQLNLDSVWFMPSGNPPHKRDRAGRANDKQRVEMVKKAIAENAHFELSLFEMNQDGYSYTYLTLEKLKEQYPDHEFFFIIGADSLFDFPSWKEPARICAACKMVVATRNHTSLQELNDGMKEMAERYQGTFLRLDTTDIDISSNHIREMIQKNESIRYYVPDSVKDYIDDHHIYRPKRGSLQ